jgi:hypothetical protein
MRFILYCLLAAPAMAAVPVSAGPGATARELLGVERLRAALANVSQPNATVTARVALAPEFSSASEAFHILRRGNEWLITGSDPSGVLYGCLELTRRVNETGGLPQQIDFADHPRFLLRGPNIGMQKTTVTYDGAVYDYRYTPEEFGFFYDKQLWTRYLDFLLEEPHEHSLPVERPPLHFPASPSQVSRSAGTA